MLSWVSLPFEMTRAEHNWKETSRYHLLEPALNDEQGPRRQMEDAFAGLVARFCSTLVMTVKDPAFVPPRVNEVAAMEMVRNPIHSLQHLTMYLSNDMVTRERSRGQ